MEIVAACQPKTRSDQEMDLLKSDGTPVFGHPNRSGVGDDLTCLT